MSEFDPSPLLWFVCKYCKRAFKLSKELIKHKKKIHLQEFLRDKKQNRQRKFNDESQNLLVPGTETSETVIEASSLPNKKIKVTSTLPSTCSTPAAPVSSSKVHANITIGTSSISQGQGQETSKSNREITSGLTRIENQPKFKCDYCEKLCQTKSAMISHKRIHKRTASQLPRRSSSSRLPKSVQTAQDITRAHDNKITKIPGRSTRHTRNSNRKSRIDNLKSKALTKSVCEICKMVFQSKHTFENHVRNRNGNCNHNLRSFNDSRKFKCYMCLKKFKTNNECRRHELCVHAFKCKFCSRSYIFKTRLDDHDYKHHKIAQVEIEQSDLKQFGFGLRKKNSSSYSEHETGPLEKAVPSRARSCTKKIN